MSEMYGRSATQGAYDGAKKEPPMPLFQCVKCGHASLKRRCPNCPASDIEDLKYEERGEQQ